MEFGRSFGRLSKYKLTIGVKTEKAGDGLEIGLKTSKGRVIIVGKFPQCGQQFHSFEIFTFIITSVVNNFVNLI